MPAVRAGDGNLFHLFHLPVNIFVVAALLNRVAASPVLTPFRSEEPTCSFVQVEVVPRHCTPQQSGQRAAHFFCQRSHNATAEVNGISRPVILSLTEGEAFCERTVIYRSA